MNRNQRFAAVRAAREEFVQLGTDPFAIVIDRILSPTEGMIRGKRTILAGTNNYLGSTFDAACIAAGVQALQTEGTGTTGSRMANGSYAGHRALEVEIAAFYGKHDAIVFSTGYQANLGTITALVEAGDTVVIDADSHASIYDACRMSGADIVRFRHNDPEDLAKRLRRLGDAAKEALIVVEGVYSMLGDKAPLAEFLQVAHQHGALLMVDEAHSLGVLGATGQGLCEELGVTDQVDFIVGTFSKSLGNTGGFCASSNANMDVLRYASRPYVFTASLPPATIAATRAALKRLAAGKDLRARLRANADRLHAGLEKLGFSLGAPANAVVAVLLGDKRTAMQLWNHLMEHGVYVNLMVPPATPGKESLLRCSISAAHTFEQIDAICAAFASWKTAH